MALSPNKRFIGGQREKSIHHLGMSFAPKGRSNLLDLITNLVIPIHSPFGLCFWIALTTPATGGVKLLGVQRRVVARHGEHFCKSLGGIASTAGVWRFSARLVVFCPHDGTCERKWWAIHVIRTKYHESLNPTLPKNKSWAYRQQVSSCPHVIWFPNRGHEGPAMLPGFDPARSVVVVVVVPSFWIVAVVSKRIPFGTGVWPITNDPQRKLTLQPFPKWSIHRLLMRST